MPMWSWWSAATECECNRDDFSAHQQRQSILQFSPREFRRRHPPDVSVRPVIVCLKIGAELILRTHPVLLGGGRLPDGEYSVQRDRGHLNPGPFPGIYYRAPITSQLFVPTLCWPSRQRLRLRRLSAQGTIARADHSPVVMTSRRDDGAVGFGAAEKSGGRVDRRGSA